MSVGLQLLSSPALIPRYRTLDGFVEALSQADGVGLIEVDASTTPRRVTDSSTLPSTQRLRTRSDTPCGRSVHPLEQVALRA